METCVNSRSACPSTACMLKPEMLYFDFKGMEKKKKKSLVPDTHRTDTLAAKSEMDRNISLDLCADDN
jgi:hypothetical protein